MSAPVATRNAPTTPTSPVRYDYLDFALHEDGTFTYKGKVCDWYKDQKTGKPWIPAKRKTFVSLVKAMERDGDFKEGRA